MRITQRWIRDFFVDKYRTFLQVVSAGSFSSASRLMGVAPSSVSRQINDLEEDLSVQLFHRTTRKLSLTEAGEIFHERALKIILDLDEARLAVSQLGAPSGVLRVSVPSGIGKPVATAQAMLSLDVTYYGDTSLEVAWNGAVDNVAVVTYLVYRDGVAVGSMMETSYHFSSPGR